MSDNESVSTMTDTSLFTGTDRGIGLEYCRQIKEKGFKVIAVCRKPSPELLVMEVQVLADMT